MKYIIITCCLLLLLATGLAQKSASEDSLKPLPDRIYIGDLSDLRKMKRDTTHHWAQFFEMGAVPDPVPAKTGPVNLKLMVIPWVECDNAQMHIEKIYGLECAGPLDWSFEAKYRDTLYFDVPVIVSDTDGNSGLEFYAECYPYTYRARYSFAVIADTIYCHNGAAPSFERLRRDRHPETLPPPDPDRFKPKPDTTTYQYQKRTGRYDKDGNFIPQDSVVEEELSPFKRAALKYNWQPGDTTVGWYREDDGEYRLITIEEGKEIAEQRQIARQQAEMRELEKEPLTEYSGQHFKVGDTDYYRQRGEYKFHIEEAIPDSEIEAYLLRRLDSVKTAENKDYDITLDLRDPEHFRVATSLIDSLIPTDSTDYYRAIVKWKTRSQLKDAKILHHITGRPPTVPRDRSK